MLHIQFCHFLNFFLFIFSLPTNVSTHKSNSICYQSIEHDNLKCNPEVKERRSGRTLTGSEEFHLNINHDSNHVEIVGTESFPKFLKTLTASYEVHEKQTESDSMDRKREKQAPLKPRIAFTALRLAYDYKSRN